MEVGFLDVLLTVFSLVLLAVPGYLLVKCKVLGEKADKALSGLVLFGLQPALMVNSYQKTAFNSDIGLNILICAGIAFVVHFIMIAFVSLVFRSKDDKISVLKFASVFSNCGYMGMPFLNMLYPDTPEVLIYAGVIMSAFNVLNWTVGVYFISHDRSQISLKKVLLNPVLLGVAVGLILFFVVKTPLKDVATEGTFLDGVLTKLMTAVGYLAEAVTPCSMIVIGMRLANVPVKNLFLDKWAYVNAFNKLCVMSLITILCVVFLPIDDILKFVMFFCLSMPSASGTVMFAVNYNGDADSASVFVLSSTILSVLTIPLMYLLFTVFI